MGRFAGRRWFAVQCSAVQISNRPNDEAPFTKSLTSVFASTRYSLVYVEAYLDAIYVRNEDLAGVVVPPVEVIEAGHRCHVA